MPPKPDAYIAHYNCPTGCVIFQERRVGKYGTFYFCNRCKNTISEHPKGGIDTPCGTCTICGGLMFWRTLADGTRFKACWTPQKHSAVFKPKTS